MSRQISSNIRYLLWRKRIPRAQWDEWLSERTSLEPRIRRALVGGQLDDTQVSANELQRLASLFNRENEPESLRLGDLSTDDCNILQENLRFLFQSLGRGGKKSLSGELGVDPTTISRWLNGSFEPQPSSLGQIISYFGLPPETDLHEKLLCLSIDPVALTDRRSWIHSRIDALSAKELIELYPAFQRLLEER